MKKHNLGKTGPAGACALILAATTISALAADSTNTLVASDNDNASWLDKTISPVSNPILFEDPKIDSEVHPIYMFHFLPDTFEINGGAKVPMGGQVQVAAVQLRYAINDRLAIIATKDGYIEFQPDHTLAHHYGFADLAAGLKYALINDASDQVIVTPGFTLTVPTGSTAVYQGKGSGEWNVFVSAEKGWSNFHITGNVGFNIPDNLALQTAQLHYSLQLDYYVHQYFIPFFAVNGYTILSEGHRNLIEGVPLNTELYDLINSGSTAAGGTTQFTVGGGFRTRFTKNVDAGVAYEAGVVDPVGIFDARVTTDLIWRF
ncbi:MAG: hypothetical protein ABSE48_03280 [Verrucomicrobiota bacterium]|jgi:hypothetical protein